MAALEDGGHEPPRFISGDDLADAADLLAAWGRSDTGGGGALVPEVRDAVHAAIAADRARELVAALLTVIGGTFPGAFAAESTQQTLRLTALGCREGLVPRPDYGVDAL